MPGILIIDDDTRLTAPIQKYLQKHGYEVDHVTSASAGRKQLIREDYSLVITDYHLPDSDGFKLLQKIKDKEPFLPVIVLTSHTNLPLAVKMIKAGAYDYITKPLIPEVILDLVKLAIEETQAQEQRDKEQDKDQKMNFEKQFIHGRSKEFKEVLRHVKVVAPVDMTVIIEGETGSGKEFIARAIHQNSVRSEGPFVAIDCGALTKNLVNSELFGHVKGAFTGATYDKPGVFEQASGGTLFLDELSNLDAENQVMLLRVLQEKTLTRIGDTRSVKVDVRMVVASNQNLREEVMTGKLREDLFHRLNEFKIVVPALRERKEDIDLFAREFIKRAAQRFKKEPSELDETASRIIHDYSWPGNIRELKNVMTRAVLLARSNLISSKLLPEEINTGSPGTPKGEVDLKIAVENAERTAILDALQKTNYNKSEAARLLNIDRKTLYNKINQFEISTDEETD